MLGREVSAPIARFALSLFLFATSIASTHLVHDLAEAGFSRVKVVFRTRAWRDDPSALQARSLMRHPACSTRGSGGAVLAGAVSFDGD
jgi:hypothetical protein